MHEAPIGEHDHVLAIIFHRIGAGGIEDQRSDLTEREVKIRVAMVPEGAGVPDGKLIDERLARLNAGKAHSGHAIHLKWHQHAVPMDGCVFPFDGIRSEEHTSELQSLMRISYAVFCLKNKKKR